MPFSSETESTDQRTEQMLKILRKCVSNEYFEQYRRRKTCKCTNSFNLHRRSFVKFVKLIIQLLYLNKLCLDQEGLSFILFGVGETYICYNKRCVISSDKARSTKMAPEAKISERCFAESIPTGIQDWNVMHYGYITEKELKNCLPRSKQQHSW